MTGELPPGWSRASLADVGSWGSGGTPSRSDAKAYCGDIPWLKIGDLPDGPVVSAEERITEHGLAISAAKLLPPNTLLIAMYGSIGKLGITTEPCATNQAIAFCKPHAGLSLHYLFYLLMRERHRLVEKGQGGTQLNISQTILKAHEVSIAPSAEQERIVSKIDELFSRIDEGERALERASLLVERYRQSVLKAAVTGELTRAWREKNKDSLESGEALLSRILTARREAWEKAELEKMKAKGITPASDKWKQKYEGPSPPDITGLPALPDGWAWATPVQLESSIANAMAIGPFGSNLRVPDYRSEGVPLIFVRNIRSKSFNTDDGKFVSVEKAKELASHIARAGDVLVTKMGDPPGDACVYPVGSQDAIITADCIKWTLHPLLASREYFAEFINSALGRSQIAVITKGVAQQKVSLERFRQIAIALPGPEEQAQIAERLDIEAQRLSRISDAIAHEKRRSSAARQSILRAAFSGMLVGQDPSDEPASILLERIAAERGADTATSKRSRKKKIIA